MLGIFEILFVLGFIGVLSLGVLAVVLVLLKSGKRDQAVPPVIQQNPPKQK